MLLSVEQRLQIEPEVLKLVGCLRKRLARTRLVCFLHVKQHAVHHEDTIALQALLPIFK